MKLETRYNLGDTVYMVQQSMEYTYTECTMCNEEGQVLAQIDNKEYNITCPVCRGTKKIQMSKEPLWGLREEVNLGISTRSPKAKAIFTIKEIIVSEESVAYKIRLQSPDLSLTRFSLDRFTRVVKESELFPSKEEAIAYCNKMNGIEPLLDGEKDNV